MDSILNILTEGVQEDNKDTFHNHRYEPTSYDILEQIFEAFPLSPSDVLVDYGCGKGRLNYYVHHRFGCGTVGIEYNPQYCSDAQVNLTTYTDKEKELIQFHCCKGEDYVVQDCDTVFYFFNPFSEAIFCKVVNRILTSYEQNPRTMTIMLYYPSDEYLYYLEEMTPFMEIGSIALDGVEKNARERVVVYGIVG